LARNLLVLAILGVGAALIGPYSLAKYHFYRGRSQLQRYHSQAALAHFEAVLRVWPDDENCRLLASRAARRLGRFDEAANHLRHCQDSRRPPTPQLTLEWSCLRATEGDLLEVESYLFEQQRAQPELAALIWEALAEGYIRACRSTDALKCLNQWLERDSNNVQALFLLGNLHQSVGAHALAVNDYLRVLALAAERDDARRRLAMNSMSLGRYQDALSHWANLQERFDNDPDIPVRAAHCHDRCNRTEIALGLLERALALRPGYGPALRTRGQLELARERPAEAEVWLRQAVQEMPYDYASHYALFDSLRAQNKEAEKLLQEQHMREIKDRLERIGEIMSREISLHPRDVVLQLELASLLLSVNRKEEGLFWLLNAEKLNPRSRSVYLALAAYYREEGKSEQEEICREQALSLPDDQPKPK